MFHGEVQHAFGIRRKPCAGKLKPLGKSAGFMVYECKDCKQHIGLALGHPLIKKGR